MTGLMVKEGAYLKVANLIYAEIFRPWWVDRRLTSLCPYQTDLDQWLSSKCDKRWLLNKQSLQEARVWAGERSLSEEHHQFLMRSQSYLHEQEMARQDTIRKREKAQTMEQADAISIHRIAKLKQQLIISWILCSILLLSVIVLTLTR